VKEEIPGNAVKDEKDGILVRRSRGFRRSSVKGESTTSSSSSSLATTSSSSSSSKSDDSTSDNNVESSKKKRAKRRRVKMKTAKRGALKPEVATSTAPRVVCRKGQKGVKTEECKEDGEETPINSTVKLESSDDSLKDESSSPIKDEFLMPVQGRVTSGVAKTEGGSGRVVGDGSGSELEGPEGPTGEQMGETDITGGITGDALGGDLSDLPALEEEGGG